MLYDCQNCVRDNIDAQAEIDDATGKHQAKCLSYGTRTIYHATAEAAESDWNMRFGIDPELVPVEVINP